VSLLPQLSRPSHVRVSVGFSLTQMALAKRGMIFLVFLLYTIYRLYFVSLVAFVNLTSFQWQEGGALALTLFMVCIWVQPVTGSRILFRGKLAIVLVSCLVSYPSSSVSDLNTVNRFQLLCFSYHFQLPQYSEG
jgi:hypothetical protein